jgi:hypothetical protein
MIASTVIMSIGTGLLTTFEPSTASPTWIGFQALAGIGIGLGMQLPLIGKFRLSSSHRQPWLS